MDEIKPVALALGRYGFPNGDEPRPVPEPMKGYWTPWHIAQQAIDTLRAEVAEALAAADSKAGWEWKKRAERAEAEAEALRKDAERYRWLCDGNGYFMEENYLCGHENDKERADLMIDIEIQAGQ